MIDKLYKIQKKIVNVNSSIDIMEYSDDILRVKGWIFSKRHKVNNIKFVLISAGKRYPLAILTDLKRKDVNYTYKCVNSEKPGFYGQAVVENMSDFTVWMCFQMNGKEYKFCIGKFDTQVKGNTKMPPRVQMIEEAEEGIDAAELLKEKEEGRFTFPQQLYGECIDVIIPIYNGYQFFDKLFETVSKTKMKYRLILINDNSPDERVASFLEKYAKENKNVILITNEENKGFVKNVNIGLKDSANHVALVNSDVELPDMWLERLMLPILQDELIASSTPYTNCGTICSFPKFAEDNELFLNLDLDTIDAVFKKIDPKYVSMPTGVGFCMGMNRKVIDQIGGFDEESFGMGYGEENDWCQRAFENGYKNVHVENLFVYHKHGGSFLSENKKKYLEEHGKILSKKHPYYNKDVARFCSLDPNKEVREFVKFNLLQKKRKEHTIVAFDHDLGGGATAYLNDKKKNELENGNCFCIIRYNITNSYYKINYYYEDYVTRLHVNDTENLFKVIDYIGGNQVWINELATYPDLYEILNSMREYRLSHDVYLKMLLHDFFAVCPTINLLNDKEYYCNIPCETDCNKCLRKQKNIQDLEQESIRRWRNHWKELLEVCDEVTVFSNDSKEIYEKAFGKQENIVVCPHTINYIPVLNKQYKTTDTLNIGLLGSLTKHKGRILINELCKIIEKDKLPINITLIGSASKKIKSSVYKETGRYTRDGIPRRVFENDIDIFLIPSIWPETFSYTTEEIMQMGMPIMCFDIGAPAERVAKYDKGVVISEVSAKAILDTVKNNSVVKKCLEKERKKTRVLFAVEEIGNFTARYRVEHLREQLLHHGIASDCVMIDDAYKCDLKKYSMVIIYRCEKVDQVNRLVKKAQKFNKEVYYDIDDYIFDYEKIKGLKFLEGKEYKNFKKYADNLNGSMSLCDGVIVSTENLKKVVQKCWPEKKVLINRNVASMEMLTTSLGVTKKENDKIKIGYFSGSNTHNEDFNIIKDVLVDIMRENSNVEFFVGGQIELPPEFNEFKERIDRFEFVSWKKLPGLVAQADINLMPLEDTFFHSCKSENKWMEAALVKVPTVASWNDELARVISDGENGFLCKSKEEWKSNLQNMIDSKELRDKIASNAHEKVINEYTTFHVEQEILDLVENKF